MMHADPAVVNLWNPYCSECTHSIQDACDLSAFSVVVGVVCAELQYVGPLPDMCPEHAGHDAFLNA